MGYLTNTVTANSQVTASALGVLASGTPVTLSSTNWATLSSNSFLLPMIFEGIATGRCVITFGFSSNSGPAVALSRPFYLDLKHVTDLYEHWTVGDDIITDWYQIPPKAARTADSAVFGNPQKQEDLDYILFVHGWRMQPWERRAFASTAYKRLWHLGYKGRFGLYSWPTDWTSTSPWDMTTQYNRQNYDRSEQRAWNASWGLWRLLMDLNTRQSGRVRMIAHSMGNITASEALRFRGLNPNKPPLVQGYIASQAASVAFAYDAVHPEDVGTFGIFTPEVYAEFPRGNATNVYFTGMKNAVQRDQNLNPRIINFHNKQDYALNSTFAWPANQLFKPDVNYSYHIFEGTWWRNLMVHTELFLTTDQWEIFAHIAQARSKALGCSEDPSHQVRGEIGGSVDLNATPFNYGKNDYEHSAEFNSINMNRRSYWWQVLSTFSLTNTLPNP
ncbi:MAG: alpha/beta hydrolase [Verrucomicrobiota bacterium]